MTGNYDEVLKVESEEGRNRERKSPVRGNETSASSFGAAKWN